MAEFERKEKYSGMWNGKEVSFNRTYRGKRLTDEECEALLDGKTIRIDGLVSKSSGKTYGVKGKLDNLEYNGHKYVGISDVGFVQSGVPKVFCQHEFTEDERNLLERGDTVFIEDYVSKKTGNTFSCNTRYDAEEGRIVLEFNK